MKLFISWSGEKSHEVATVLHEFLPCIIQVLKPFMSSGDILKGERWGDVLAKELEDTRYGIICLTPSNINSTWLSFEAGALSKSVDRSFVSPFLFQVETEAIERGPLSQFQTTIFKKEDIFNLLTSINNSLESDKRLEVGLLRRVFEMWWPQLEIKLTDAKHKYEHESTTGCDWLYPSKDLSEIQQNTNCKSIWVVIPRIHEALQTTCDRQMLESNIQRGIKYNFILPVSEARHEATETLWRIFSERSGEKDIYEVPQHEFTLSAITQFLMLNPKVEDDQYPLRVFLELPVTGQHNYWVEVEKEAAYTVVERFDIIAKKTGVSTEFVRDGP